jgi:hypothetical protein
MSLIIGQCLGYVQVVSVYWVSWYLSIGESLTGLLRFATLTSVRVQFRRVLEPCFPFLCPMIHKQVPSQLYQMTWKPLFTRVQIIC